VTVAGVVLAGAACWPAAAGSRWLLLAALLAVAVFGTAWALLHRGFYQHKQIVDTPIYFGYGEAITHGKVPYRDFRPEYPPAALPVFVLPALGHDRSNFDGFRRAFERLMAVCGALAVVFAAAALGALRARGARLAAAVAFVALAPLALGSVVLSRYDLWPAAIMVGALAALVAGRLRLGSAALGLGAAAKVFPAVLFPLALAYAWRRGGRREAVVCALAFAAVLVVVFVPFLVVAPGGVWDFVHRQASRPLQLESLGSAVLLAAHHVGGLALTVRSSSGSQNLAGSLPDALAAGQTVLQIVVVAALWIAFARGPAHPERLVRYAAATLAAFVTFGKVLSPQFLIWLIPVVPLVRGRRGLTATALLAVALVLTQLWFPFRYWNLPLQFAARESWLVFARDLVLVALTAVLASPTRERGRARSS
jgi:hypothetical protein